MAPKFSTEAAVAVVSLAAFQLWQSWRDTAPSFEELRRQHSSDFDARQRLMDADLSVGSMAVLIGVTLAVLTRDFTALVLMLVIVGSLSLWSHQILAAPSTIPREDN